MTQASVAQASGTSASTVRMILSNHPQAKRYSEKTRRRVLESAKRLNYRPDFFASQLKHDKRRLIALCSGSLGDEYPALVATAFEARAAQRGYHLLVSGLQNQRRAGAGHLLGGAVGRHGIGMLAVVGYNSEPYLSDDDLIELTREGVGVVCIGRPIESTQVSQIIYDNPLAQDSVARTVYRQGLDRVWLLTTDAACRMTRERVAAVQRVADEYGAPPPRVLVSDDHEMHNYAAPIRQALRHGPPPQAVIATSDYLAIAAMIELDKRGLKAGRDVAVTGFNGMPLASLFDPPLTTVRLPVGKMGEAACDALIDQCEGGGEIRRVMLPSELIEGGTHLVQ